MDLVAAVVAAAVVVVVAAAVDQAGWADRRQPGLAGTVCALRVVIGRNTL